jgi:stress-induced morphogen
MPITADQIRSKILQALPDAEVTVEDTTGTGDHYAATIVTASFQGRGPVDRHRMIYAALGDAMNGPIHALALTTRTPEEYERRRS